MPATGGRSSPEPAQQLPAASKKPTSFYMRELPTEKLVGYETPQGKELFKAALNEGGLEAFFPLSQQFLTVSRARLLLACHVELC
jgi:hypothetical protein